MKNKAKKIVASLLTVLMLLSVVPMGMLSEAQLTAAFGTTADAAGLNKYCATAAAEWAKQHVYDYWSCLTGKGYYSGGGDCAHFVSQCLYMGGIDMDKYWNTSGWHAHYGPNPAQLGTSDYFGSFIRCDELYNYLKKLGAKEIRNPSASDVSIGDVILYCSRDANDKTHSAIVIDKVNGVPVVAAHSVDGKNAMYTSYDGRDWHLGFSGNLTFLLKLNGSTCVNNGKRSFDVYTANKYPYLYVTTNTRSGHYKQYLSGEYTHVYETKTVNGVKWGYTFRYGYWGWIRLSEFTFQSHIDSPSVDHDWGDWQTVQVANCRRDGIDRRTCRRCGLTDDKITKGGHVVDPKASCLAPGVCKICGEEIDSALGHDYTGEWTVTLEPTCTEKGERKLYCPRVSNGKKCGALLKTEEIAALGHDYVAGATDPNCVSAGTKTYHCTRGDSDYVDYIDADNTWSDWTQEVHSAIPESKVQTKTQYRYRTKQTQESTATSINGWTRTGKSYWQETGNGSFEYVAAFPAGYSKSNGFYQKYNKAVYSAYENETNKRTVTTGNTGKYLYWHWCDQNTYSGGPVDRRISDCYWSGTISGQTRYMYTFHAFETYTKMSFNSDGLVYYKDSSECKCTYWWFGWAENDKISSTEIPVKICTYTDFKHVFEYYKWDDWSEWQDEPISANDNTEVETRTLYRYDLAALGHDFSVATDKTFVSENKQLETDENGTLKEPLCRTSGYVCSRCGAVSPDSVNENHIIPVWETERDAYELVSENDSVKIYRAECKNGCGCYILRTEQTCSFAVDKVVEPTCTTDGYTQYKCGIHGETYTDNTVKALGHDLTNGKTEIIKAPDCVNAGIKRTYCVRFDNGKTCDCYKDENIAPLGHKLTKHDAVAVTCLTDGSKEYYECSVCGKFYSDKNASNEMKDGEWVIKSPGKHLEPDEWEIITEASCGTAGRKVKHCVRVNGDTVCGELLKEEEIPEISPVYVVESYENASCKNGEYDGSEYVCDTWESTGCETFGILHLTCKNCRNDSAKKHGYDLMLEPKAHVESDWIEDVAPSCVQVGHKHTECINCGLHMDDDSIAALGHIKGESVTVYPTCTAGGYTYWICKREGCSETREDGSVGAHIEKYDIIAATGHSASPKEDNYDSASDKMELVSSVKNVCGNGTVDTYRCTHLDKNNNNKRCTYTVVVGESKGHNISDGYTVTKQPTCTEDGIKVKVCTNDGCTYQTDETVIPALGHDFKHDSSRDIDAKCTEPGIEGYTCSRCDAHNDSVLPELGHDLTLAESNNASCTEPGTEIYKCRRNGCTHSETKLVGDALGHDYSGNYTVTEKASCTDTGTKTLTCIRVNDGKICGETLDTTEIPAREHNWSGWSISKAPTCTDNGTEKRNCTHTDETDEYTACTAYETKVVSSIGHTYGKWVDNGDGKTHTKTCTRTSCTAATANHTVTANHKMSKTAHLDASCTTDGYDEYTCSDCGYKYKSTVTKLGHDWGEWTVTSPAACTTDGEETRVCMRDASHIEKRTVTHTGHKEETDAAKAATCTETGLTEGKHCSTCHTVIVAQKTVPALGHDWGAWTVTSRAACTTDGEETRVCKRDASHIEKRTVTHTGHKEETDAAKAATCTETGLTEGKHCSTCHTVIVAQKTVPALGHDWGEWTVTSPAACTTDGEETRVCKRDASHIEKRTVTHTGHNGGKLTVTAKADCTTDGIKEQHCTNSVNGVVCGEKLTSEIIKARGHEWGEWIMTKQPTYDEYGEMRRYCTHTDETEEYLACTAYETKPVEKLDKTDIVEDKSVKYDDVTGEAEITLSASAKGNTVSVPRKDQPLDIVLVVDMSGSMANDGKQQKTMDAINEFVSNVEKNAEDGNADHRIAIVSFAYGSIPGGRNYDGYRNKAYCNTALYTTASGKTIKYKDVNGRDIATNADYAGALLSVKSQKELLKNSISRLAATAPEGATAASLGLDMAKKIFANSTDKDGRERIVVFLTDGQPTLWSSFDMSEAAKAISSAQILKSSDGESSCNASVYSIGIFGREDAANGNINKFMRLVSSENLNAVSMNSNAAKNPDTNYYFLSENADNLTEIFSTIEKASTTYTAKFDDVTLCDTVSEYFTVTTEQEKAMREKIIADNPYLTNDDITVERREDGTTYIEVRNITPIQNGDTFTAKISFTVSANENALSAGTYVTNTLDAGVNLDGKRVAYFIPPEVAVSEHKTAIFRINGEVFKIVRVDGDTVSAPETNFDDGFEFSGWDTVDYDPSSNCEIFDATLTAKEYTATFAIGNENRTAAFAAGELFTFPKAAAPDGYIITGWQNAPVYMPSGNVTVTAVLEKHDEHIYKSENTKKPGCVTSGERTFTCDCGKTYTEEIPALGHNYVGIVLENKGTQSLSFVCMNCMDIVAGDAECTANEIMCGKTQYSISADSLSGTAAKLIVPGGNYSLANGDILDVDGITAETSDGLTVVTLTGSASFTVSDKTTDGEHRCGEFTVTKPATCTEDGEETAECLICGETVMRTVDALGHRDENGDGKCDVCGTSLSPEKCTHLCHSSSKFVRFFWKIICFFNKLFRTNQYCSCGAKHW